MANLNFLLSVMKKPNTIKYRNNFESDVGDELVGWSYEPVFVFTNSNKKVRKGSKLTMGEWCDKEGFKWFTKETLQELKSYGPTVK